MIDLAEQLDRYWACELGCSPEALLDGGVTVAAPPHREQPRWMGWLVPLECIVLDRAAPGSGVVSVTPAIAPDLERYLREMEDEVLPPRGSALTPFIRAHFPHGYPKVHRILQCSPADVTPAPEVFPISQLPEDDIHASWYRLHFDGPIFVARDERGLIASWAAVKCKSSEIWEMAVVTEARYRNRGLARSVVSRATLAALDAGKTPLYLHEISNTPSATVCRAVGYRPYGYELTCENGRVTPQRS